MNLNLKQGWLVVLVVIVLSIGLHEPAKLWACGNSPPVWWEVGEEWRCTADLVSPGAVGYICPDTGETIVIELSQHVTSPHVIDLCVGQRLFWRTVEPPVFSTGVAIKEVIRVCYPGGIIERWPVQTNLVEYVGYIYLGDPGYLYTTGTYYYAPRVVGVPDLPYCGDLIVDLPTNIIVRVWDYGDSDGDDWSDCEEVKMGSDPYNPSSTPCGRVAYWGFDDPGYWRGNRGQGPMYVINVTGVRGWNDSALCVDGAPNESAMLKYRTREEDPFSEGYGVNFTWRSGTVRFWFQPNWSSVSAGGSGPQNWAMLFDAQRKNGNERWRLRVNPEGSVLQLLTTSSSGTVTINLQTSISWRSNQWYQLAVTYSPASSALYLDGQLVATGSGMIGLGAQVFDGEFTIGSDTNGALLARGQFDDLETFSCPKSGDEIRADYLAAYALDSDGDGLPNLIDADPDTYDRSIPVFIITSPPGGTVYP